MAWCSIALPPVRQYLPRALFLLRSMNICVCQLLSHCVLHIHLIKCVVIYSPVRHYINCKETFIPLLCNYVAWCQYRLASLAPGLCTPHSEKPSQSEGISACVVAGGSRLSLSLSLYLARSYRPTLIRHAGPWQTASSRISCTSPHETFWCRFPKFESSWCPFHIYRT